VVAVADLSLERTGRITGSRVGGVLGLSPYWTRAQVMREMVREYHWAEAEFSGNFVTDYGREHEPDAIAEYELLHGVHVENKGDDQLTVVHRNGLFAYTADGLVPDNPDDGVAEGKAPFRALYTHWRDRPDYEAQMRLGCDTLQRGWCDFIVWRRENTAISRLHAGVNRFGEDFDWFAAKPREWLDDYILDLNPALLEADTVMGEIERFLEEYNDTIASEELSAPHLEPIQDQRTDDEWLAAVATYFDLFAEKSRIDRYFADAKQALETLADGKTTKGGGLQVIYRKPSAGGQGQISYKNALEALVPEEQRTPAVLDRYRGKPSKGGGRGTYAFKHITEKEA
jgi:hypothetical protein